jgi:hypothetical protein
VAKVSAVIQGARAKSVYIVGVGDLSSGTMDQWAAASGNPAISLVSMTPTQAAATLRAALDGIRTSAVSCSFAIPAPSGPGSIDYTKLNVTYQAGNGSVQDLRRASNGTSSTCSGSTLGWYYDNPAAPKAINLCPSTCSAFQQDAGAKIQVVFGCTTQVF